MNVSKKDNEGHSYEIPSEFAHEFDSIIDTISSCPIGSDEWYEANDLLDYEFGKFMVG